MAKKISHKTSKRIIIVLSAAALLMLALNAVYGWSFWLTPDQQGRLFLDKGQYETAARRFEEPMWKGISYYAAEEFEKAAQQFSRVNAAEGFFNLGNAYAQLAEYPKAVQAYQHALKLRPDYPQAKANLEQISLFIPKDREEKGGDMGSTLAADEIKFSDEKMDNNENSKEIQQQGELTDRQLQDIWMRQVQTTPADFLRSKFYFQHQMNQVQPESDIK